LGGEVRQDTSGVTILPRDGARSRLFIAPLGLWLTLDSGKIASVRFEPGSGRVTLTVDPGNRFTPAARLRIERTMDTARNYEPADKLPLVRGAYVIPLSIKRADLTLVPR
jgi:hypothetical protein